MCVPWECVRYFVPVSVPVFVSVSMPVPVFVSVSVSVSDSYPCAKYIHVSITQMR